MIISQIIDNIISKDTKLEHYNDLATFILNKITRKRFRKRHLGQEMKNTLLTKIQASIVGNTPITFAIPFGGYKHFSSVSYPLAGRAEVFHLLSMYEYVRPILNEYNPGVVIEYISEDLILPLMNNYPQKDIEAYLSSLKLIIEWINKYLNANITFKLQRVSDMCDAQKIIDEVNKLLPERKENWKKLTEDEKAIELKRSNRSIFWGGQDNLEGFDEAQKAQKIIDSRLIELSFYDVEAYPEFIGEYYVQDQNIPICFSFGLSPDNIFDWLTIGSLPSSIVDFRIGSGIMQVVDGNFSPRILSAKQYKLIKNDLKVSSIDPWIDVPGLETLSMYNGKLAF